jgi:hypothetical protein
MTRFIELQGRQAHQPGLRLQVPQRALVLALALALVLAWALLPQAQALQRQEFRLQALQPQGRLKWLERPASRFQQRALGWLAS